MNGNRMKYASTPTYGMQKRPLFKRSIPARQAPETPDFSQAPSAPGALPPFQQPAVPQGFQQPSAPQASYMPQPSYFSAPQAPVMQPNTQIPFAAPNFVQSGMPLPPMQNAAQPRPIGNIVPPLQNTGASFSGRAQGFVPPVQPMQPVQPAPQAYAPFSNPIPPQPTAPFSTFPQQSTPPQPSFSYQSAPVYPPFQTNPIPQPPLSPQPPKQAREHRSFDADLFWKFFLFGLLPLLFIPCLFLPGSFNILRFAFLALAVVGLSAMWYRQMFTPSTRLIVSMLYVALCIGAIAMLMQGTPDKRQTADVQSQTAFSQQQGDGGVALPAAAAETPAPSPTPAPTVSGPSRAEQRLELFMTLWQVNNTPEMVSLVQPSWCSKQENPSMALFMILGTRTPEDFVIEEISGTEQDNSRTITMRATINKNTGKSPSIFRFMIMMVKEGEEWYVNPNSLATNDEQQTVTEENVVNNKNAAGNVTEPPRTTVTPAPPASTPLYYNAGANFYHMDPNCESVKAEYLPFDVTFSYSELASVRSANNLSPCLRCGAPTNTLEDAGL